MNINELAPKNVNYDLLKQQATTYAGTKQEMYDLIKSGQLTIVTDNKGEIIGGWIDTKTDNTMLDAIAKENFERAYGTKCCAYMIECLQLIKEGKELPTEVEARVTHEALPSDVVANLTDCSLKSVRDYLKRTYHNCLAKGTRPSVSALQDGNIKISNICWGRAMSPNEIAELG